MAAAPSPSPAARARGALLGLAAGGDGLLALAAALGEALLAPTFDLGRAVERWIDVEASAADLPADVAAALRHLRDRGAPPRAGEPGAEGLAAHLVPVALLTHEAPANLLSGTYHLAAITHPGAEAAWAAVAFNVALARLQQGFRDFVPDVTEALRTNDAPPAVLDRLRRLPLVRREELEPAAAGAAAQAQAALWLAHHEPRADRAMAWLDAAGAPPSLRAAAGALLGARGGLEAIAAHAVVPEPRGSELQRLADRLARVGPR
jgi:ADP-ribosylglycohydrolase